MTKILSTLVDKKEEEKEDVILDEPMLKYEQCEAMQGTSANSIFLGTKIERKKRERDVQLMERNAKLMKEVFKYDMKPLVWFKRAKHGRPRAFKPAIERRREVVSICKFYGCVFGELCEDCHPPIE
jgi:hypothetical protein